jgi:hypothetical protein
MVLSIDGATLDGATLDGATLRAVPQEAIQVDWSKRTAQNRPFCFVRFQGRLFSQMPPGVACRVCPRPFRRRPHHGSA